LLCVELIQQKGKFSLIPSRLEARHFLPKG
jgi:hypothetical protein